MGFGGVTELEVTGRPDHQHVHAAGIDRLFGVGASKQDAEIPPRMIVERPVVIGALEVVQVDVEPLVARDEIPASQIGVFPAADVQISLAPVGYRDETRSKF